MIDEIKILQQAFPIRWNQRIKNVPRSAPLGCRDLNGKVIILWVLTCGTQDEELIWGETWKIIRWKRIFLPLGCIVFSTYVSGIIFPKSLCLQSSFPCSLKNCMSHEPGSTSNPTYVYIIYICIYIYISVYIIVMNNNKLNKYIYICRNMQNISRNRVGTTSSYENEAVGSTLVGSRSSFSRVTVNFWFFSCTLVRSCLHLLGRTEFWIF